MILGRGQDTARLPLLPAANSVRVYRDSRPPAEAWDESNLLQISYPTDTPVRDIMDVRQRLYRFLAAAGGEYGNWSSKAALRKAPLGLEQEIRQVRVTRGWPDLSGSPWITRSRPPLLSSVWTLFRSRSSKSKSVGSLRDSRGPRLARIAPSHSSD